MAAQLQTNEGLGETEELKAWLKGNKLIKAMDILVDTGVTLEELRDLSQQSSIKELKKYAVNTLKLDLVHSGRFAKAVFALKSTATQQPKQQIIEKVIHIVLSREEEEAINAIHEKQDIINQKINASIKDVNSLKKVGQTNENNLNQFRKQAMHRLNKRIDEIIQKSHIGIKKKEEIISKHIQQLKVYNKSLNIADSQNDDLLKNNKLNKYQRKKKIMGICANVLKKEIKDININTKVKVEIDRDAVMQFIDAIGAINNDFYPEKAIINISNVEALSATLRFANIEPDYECAVELRKHFGDDEDEKKVDEVWKEICWLKNKNKFIIKDLKGDSLYFVKAKYKNKAGFGNYSEAVPVKTKKVTIQISSSILTRKESESFLALLLANNKHLGKKWNLLYRASRDGLDRNICINKVYGKANVICFIQTDDGNVCGGYTKTGWNKSGRHKSHSKDNDAFLFGIRSSKNYAPSLRNVKNQCTDKALYYHNDTYCSFGLHPALYIYTNNNVTHNDPTAYDAFPNSRHLLGGRGNAPVTDIEVFQVK